MSFCMFAKSIPILFDKRLILVLFSTIQMDNGLQILQLPFRPLIKSAVNDCVIVSSIDEEHTILVL